MSAFTTAQRAFEEPPDDEPDMTCNICDGKGVVYSLETEIACPNCSGHGSLEAEVADNELDRQIEEDARRREEVADGER